jgi:hypothetical protein
LFIFGCADLAGYTSVVADWHDSDKRQEKQSQARYVKVRQKADTFVCFWPPQHLQSISGHNRSILQLSTDVKAEHPLAESDILERHAASTNSRVVSPPYAGQSTSGQAQHCKALLLI